MVVAVVVALMGWRTWDAQPDVAGHGDRPRAASSVTTRSPGGPSGSSATSSSRQGRLERGLVSYRAAIGILGAHYPLVVEVAKKLMGAERYEPAKALLEFAWKDQPEIAVAPELLAVIYSEEGNARGDGAALPDRARARDDDRGLRTTSSPGRSRSRSGGTRPHEARRGAIEHGEAGAWQQWVSLAYLRHQAGDTVEARAALDSAAVRARSRLARYQVDSLRAAFLGGALPVRPVPAGPPGG